MELNLYLAMVVATTIMIALPGPSVLLTVAHSISFGWRHGIITVAGATLGIALQLLVVIIGVNSLLSMLAEAFAGLRWVGAGYLVYLGIKQWRSASQPLAFDPVAVSKKQVFGQGLITTTLNPKSLLFIAAFLPQFIDAARPLGLQLTIMGPTFLLITFVVTSVWALVAGKARVFLRRQRAFRPVLRTAGGLLIIAGVGLALARRAP